MLIAIRTTVRAKRRHLAVILAVLGLATGLAAAHSALADDHMGMGVTVCLAVADAAVLAVGGTLALRPKMALVSRRPVARALAAPPSRHRSLPQPPARAWARRPAGLPTLS